MTNSTTWYPGVGADEATTELNNLVGQITSKWAGDEDGLFNVFVVALAGTFLVGDIRPYRAVFFTFSSYEGKMRMTNNAMRTRFGENKEIMTDWKEIKDSLDGFAKLRNEIAHLIPSCQSSTDPAAKANVRLVPAFWKSAFSDRDFNKLGYSIDELWQQLAPYWGYHPRIHGLSPPGGQAGYQLGYRLQEFTKKLEPSLIPLKDS